MHNKICAYKNIGLSQQPDIFIRYIPINKKAYSCFFRGGNLLKKDFLNTYCKLFQTAAIRPSAAVNFGTFFVSCKCFLGTFNITVNFPYACVFAVVRFVVYKPINIFRRIT